MLSKIGATAAGVVSLALFGLLLVEPVSALPEAQRPSVRWLQKRSEAKDVPQAVLAAKAADAPKVTKSAEPAPVPAAKPAPIPAAPAEKPAAMAKPTPAPEPVPPPLAPAKPVAKVPAAPPRVAAPAPPKPKEAAPVEPAGTGTLKVTSNPEGAEVFLDGMSVGQTPIEIDVDSGNHKVKLVDSSTQAVKNQTARVKAGATVQVDVAF